jgi:TRAP-type transport system small permease protein
MDRVFHYYCRGIEAILAIALSLMVVMVFGNVVLRYLFNSGIAFSEEASRWLFVWVTFLGAVVALHERGHLGTDFLTGRLPPAGKKLCLAVGYLLMLLTCSLVFQGSLEQTKINWDVSAPSSGASVGIFYASGIVFSVSAFVMLTVDLIKLITGHVSDQDLIIIRESEEQA